MFDLASRSICISKDSGTKLYTISVYDLTPQFFYELVPCVGVGLYMRWCLYEVTDNLFTLKCLLIIGHSIFSGNLSNLGVCVIHIGFVYMRYSGRTFYLNWF